MLSKSFRACETRNAERGTFNRKRIFQRTEENFRNYSKLRSFSVAQFFRRYRETMLYQSSPVFKRSEETRLAERDYKRQCHRLILCLLLHNTKCKHCLVCPALVFHEISRPWHSRFDSRTVCIQLSSRFQIVWNVESTKVKITFVLFLCWLRL